MSCGVKLTYPCVCPEFADVTLPYLFFRELCFWSDNPGAEAVDLLSSKEALNFKVTEYAKSAFPNLKSPL